MKSNFKKQKEDMSGKYINGSDLLITLDGMAPGHCTSHSISFQTETKQHAVKPPVSAAADDGMWQESVVTGLKYSGQAEGLVYDAETEMTIAALRKAWFSHEPVELKAFARGNATKPYLVGMVVITGVDEKSPGRDDATWTLSFESAGKPTVFEPDTVKS